MTVWQDILSGIRARPAASLALASVGVVVGVFASVGARSWSEADKESQRLLNAWPEDRTSLYLGTATDPDDVRQLFARLPEGDWWAWRVSGEVMQVKGALPPELTPKEGTPLQPDLIQSGYPAALADTSAPQNLNELYFTKGIGFMVIGKTDLPEAAEILLPAGLEETAFIPERIEIRLPVQAVLSYVRDLDFFEQLSLVDHQQKRSEAREGFRRLRRRLTFLGGGAALLTALILRSLIRMVLQERRFEFALRRSLGATPSDIRRQIITEIFVISGCPALAALLVLFPTAGATGWLIAGIVPGWFILCALPPAHHAASLPPHQALKEG